jgi:hypothetical protein
MNWYNSIKPKSFTCRDECLFYFYKKFLPAHKVSFMVANINNLAQRKEENLPQAWGWFSTMTTKCPVYGMKDHQVLDTFYNGITTESISNQLKKLRNT